MPGKYFTVSYLGSKCLVYKNDDKFFGVYNSEIGGYNPQNGAIYICHCDNIVPATEDDFDKFRIMLPPDFNQ